MVEITGPSKRKEVMFTQDLKGAEDARHKRCDSTNTLGNQDNHSWIKR
jgi:hypothetical protein